MNVCALRVLQASIGIAELLALAMQEEGLPQEDAYNRIWMVDSRGLIVKVPNWCCLFVGLGGLSGDG